MFLSSPVVACSGGLDCGQRGGSGREPVVILVQLKGELLGANMLNSDGGVEPGCLLRQNIVFFYSFNSVGPQSGARVG
jgi:hypothetical protein